MVDKDVAGAVVFEVGDLHAVGVSYLLRLEGCIDGVHLNYSFGLLSLQEKGRNGRGSVCSCVLETQGSTTSSLQTVTAYLPSLLLL